MCLRPGEICIGAPGQPTGQPIAILEDLEGLLRARKTAHGLPGLQNAKIVMENRSDSFPGRKK